MFNFISKFVRALGIFTIFTICFLAIFLATFMREMDHSSFKTLMSYSSAFESKFYDFRMKFHLDPNYKDPNIILLAIDDYSLENIGFWPIPRTMQADMIRKLKHFGAKVVSLDIMYPEKAQVCGGVSPDQDLADSFKEFIADKNQSLFLSYTLASDWEDTLKEVPDAMYNFMQDSAASGGANMERKFISTNNFPIKELVSTGVGLSHIAMIEDSDGIFRNYQFVANIDDMYFGSLGLMSYEAFTGKPTKLEVQANGSGQMKIDNSILQISSRGESKVRFMGGTEQFHTVSMYDLLKAKDDDVKMRKQIQNKIVYVGSTATGAHDLRPTPLDAKLPGVYVHMNITHMLINKFFYKPIDESMYLSLAILTIGILILLITQSFGNALADLFVLSLLIGGSLYADHVYFLPAGYQTSLFYIFVCLLGTYSWTTFLNFQKAAREKKEVKGAFGRYVSPAIVNEMLSNPDKLKVGGDKKDITCLFSDVRDFTTISEKLTPQELSSCLNRYMGAMTDIVFQTKGTLDKYIGDAIVAFWGAPLELQGHAQYAVDGAIQMMELLPSINEEFTAKGLPVFKVGIGLNSGECSVGNMGSDKIFSYTALGDNMNLGARLESLCKHYGALIIISEFTRAQIDLNRIRLRPLDKVKVKGKTKPVEIFEVMFKGHEIGDDLDSFNNYNQAYATFLNKDLSTALDLLKSVLEKHPEDKPSMRLKKVIEKFMSEGIPEVDHDVTTMTEK
jgi:adenylate cyclase